MKSQHLYAQLELISPDMLESAQRRSPSSFIPNWVTRAAHRLGRTLSALNPGSVEPQIRKRSDRQGNLWFDVYDPIAQQHYCFDSETAVRVWIDERYNH
jgi:hypothetical protein